MPYEIIITSVAEDEIGLLSTFDRATLLDAIESHLTHQPATESRSRIKKLVQPAISQYRLRVGEFRVYYDVVEDDSRIVVLHVWEKGRRSTPEGGLA